MVHDDSKSECSAVGEGPDSAVSRRFFDEMFARWSCSPNHPVSNREYAVEFLNCINEGKLGVTEWGRLLGGAQFRPESEWPNKPMNLDIHQISSFKEILKKQLLLRREKNRRAIASINRDLDAAYHRIATALNGRIVAVPHVVATKGGLSMRYQVMGYSYTEMLEYALAIVLMNFTKELRQCQLVDCGKFFLIDDKKQREYCDKSCREKHLNHGRAERVCAMRAHLPVLDWRRLKGASSGITPSTWVTLKRKKPSLTVDKYIEELANGA